MSRENLDMDGWQLDFNDYDGSAAPCISAAKGTANIDVVDDDVDITWSERADDCYGDSTRELRIPVVVLEQLLKWRAGK